MRPFPCRVGAEWRTTSRLDRIQDPYDGSLVSEVCVAEAADMEDALAAADACRKETAALPVHRRVTVLETVAAELRNRADLLADQMTRESGKPLRFSRAEIDRAVVTFQLAAAEARRFGGEVMPIDLEPRAEGRLCLTTRVPRGPVAAISPFNFPLNLIAHKLAPAIAIGAPVILKPPPQCPTAGLFLAEIALEAGWPERALSVLHCDPPVAQRMVEDPRTAVLSFTGSDTVGWKLKALAGKKQVLLELGGNAPCVVEPDTDLDAALPSLVIGSFAQAGQVCIKVQRILVHEDLHDEFLRRFVAGTEALAVGDPKDPDTVVGPLIERIHVERVMSWIAEAVAAGATVHCGDRAEGNVVLPTVLTDVPPSARVCKDEIFGPVTVVERYADFGEALDRCNASRFGLQAGVFTRDVGKALRAFRELDYGGVMINDVPTFRVDNFPYGGTKDSGFGREGVRFAMEEMTEPKVLVLRGT